VPPKDAIHSTDATISQRALEKRARRWFDRFDPPDAKTPPSTPTDDDAKTTPSTSDRDSSSSDRDSSSSLAKADRDSSSSLAKAREAALESIPAWMDKKKTSSTMSKRKKRTTLEMNRDNFDKGAIDTYYHNRYKKAWKAATTEYHTNIKGGKDKARHGFGSEAIAKRYNEDQLSSPNDRKIKPYTLRKAVAEGFFGVSPKKRGRRSKIPEGFGKALATHATMMQLSCEAEASGARMCSTIIALTAGTKWDGHFNPEYAWRKCRTENPAILNPVQAKNHEDRRVDWLTFNNINEWSDGAKKYCIDLGMLSPEPGHICEWPCNHYHYHFYRVLNLCYFFHSGRLVRSVANPSR
jgi:hypothetical protein